MKKTWNIFWRIVWNTSETLNISLGKFAPWVFEQMIGLHGRRINDNRSEGEHCGKVKK